MGRPGGRGTDRAASARRDDSTRARRCRRGVPGVSLLVVALLAVSGCLGHRRAPNPFEEESAAARSLQIEVENHGFNEATLRSVARLERRLGVVSGNGTRTFTIAWTTVDDLQIRIDILAGSRFTTNRVTVSPGDKVRLIIREPLYRSLLTR